jgi:RHS repeat-associated protein
MIYVYGRCETTVEQINNTAGTVSYLRHDQAGSTRFITGSTGETEATFTYGPYGELTGSTGTATTPLGYHRQYTSSDTGLIYLRHRVYDPSTAQFLTVDPLEVITGEPYTYAGDNPLAYGDPSGEGLVSFFESAASTVFCGFGGPEVCADEQLVITDTKVVVNDVDAILNPCRAVEDREKSIADVLGASATIAGKLFEAACLIDLGDGSSSYAFAIQVPKVARGRPETRESRMVAQLNARLAQATERSAAAS